MSCITSWQQCRLRCSRQHKLDLHAHRRFKRSYDVFSVIYLQKIFIVMWKVPYLFMSLSGWTKIILNSVNVFWENIKKYRKAYLVTIIKTRFSSDDDRKHVKHGIKTVTQSTCWALMRQHHQSTAIHATLFLFAIFILWWRPNSLSTLWHTIGLNMTRWQ